MTRTTWIALFCLVGLGPAIAIRVVTLPASVTVEPARDQDKTEMALAPNEGAKSDRLKLPDIGAETGIVTPAQAMPVETPSTGLETIKTPGRHWQDANARAFSGDSLPPAGSGADAGSSEENTSNNHKEAKGSGIAPSERPHRRTIARKSDKSAGSNPPKARAEAWHCRQDAMGSLLRSLDLSPRCNL
jgi:hypothetical protein